MQESIHLFNLIDDHIVRIMGEGAITHLELLHIAKSPVKGTLSDGEYAVKEIVEPLASCKVVGCDGALHGTFGSVCQYKD